jgi:hypothetical protein
MFDSLTLLVEHQLQDMTLIIEVRIVRTHAVGVFPIQIVVNGLAADFQSASNQVGLREKLEATFAEQESYDALTAHLRVQFDNFMNRLELAVRQQMQIDNIHKITRAKIIRPTNDIHQPDGRRQHQHSDSHGSEDPVFQRHGLDSSALSYCWLWSSMLHYHNTHVKDVSVVDEQGKPLFDVSEAGLDSGSTNIFDPSVPMGKVDASRWDSICAPESEASARSWWTSNDDSGSSGWLSGFGMGESDGGRCSVMRPMDDNQQVDRHRIWPSIRWPWQRHVRE